MWLIINYINDTDNENEYNHFKHLHIIENFTQTDEFNGGVRLSPIFLFHKNADVINQLTGCLSGKMIMIFPKNSGILISEIIKEQVNSKFHILFTLGLCSIVLYFPENSNQEDKLIEKWRDCIIGYEIWVIENNKIINFESKSFANLKFEKVNLNLSKYDFINSNPIFQEFVASLNVLEYYCSRYDDIIELNFENVINEARSILDEYFDLLNNGESNRTKLFQLEDKVIQLISNISYVTTQAFSGLTPILERRSILRRHTVFGIGNGIRALSVVVNHITTNFERFDLIARIKDNFWRNSTALVGLSNDPFVYDKSNWHHSNIDNFNVKEHTVYNSFKLPYFSARNGFRETEYAISAKIQTISRGVSKKWSVLTLTHELMHDQVRRILNFILLSDLCDNENDENKFNSYYEKIKSSLVNGFNSSEDRLIDSIRSTIYQTCIISEYIGSLTTLPSMTANSAANEYRVPNDFSDFTLFYRKYEHSINEVFVHIFDFHYIYRREIQFYLKSIWTTWFTVNNVFSNLREYVLRSLFVASVSISTDDPMGRFNESINILRDSILSITPEENNTSEVLEYLEKKCNDECCSTYLGYLKFVDVIGNIFLSDDLSDKLIHDENILTSSEMHGDLNYEYFGVNQINVEIGSPISYLMARLEYIDELNEDESIDDNTCLSYLALS